jgi:hypothetical protein
LEPLREKARTFVGPKLPERTYAIPFTKREDFESTWPHLLMAKSKGAPIILMRGGPRTDFLGVKPGGVLIHSPPAEPGGTPESAPAAAAPKAAEAPVASGSTPAATAPKGAAPAAREVDARTKWRDATYIELVVDGEIVDLNRIRLPSDSPIIDERFKDDKAK